MLGAKPRPMPSASASRPSDATASRGRLQEMRDRLLSGTGRSFALSGPRAPPPSGMARSGTWTGGRTTGAMTASLPGPASVAAGPRETGVTRRGPPRSGTPPPAADPASSSSSSNRATFMAEMALKDTTRVPRRSFSRHNSMPFLTALTTVWTGTESIEQRMASLAMTASETAKLDAFYDVKQRERDEVVLQDNPGRFVLFPIQYSQIWRMYKSGKICGVPRHSTDALAVLHETCWSAVQFDFGDDAQMLSDHFDAECQVSLLQVELICVRTGSDGSMYRGTGYRRPTRGIQGLDGELLQKCAGGGGTMLPRLRDDAVERTCRSAQSSYDPARRKL